MIYNKTLFSFIVVNVLGFMTLGQYMNISSFVKDEDAFFKNLLKLKNSSNSVKNRRIYWNDDVENLIPTGLSEDAADMWITNTRSAEVKVKSLVAATKSKCGHWGQRGQPIGLNGIALLTDGSKMCVRLRMDQNELLVGDSLSYWLARFLTLDNVPPVALTYSLHAIWSDVKVNMTSLGWKNGCLLGLNLWVNGIDNSKYYTDKWRRVNMPILNAYRLGVPVTIDTFKDIDLGDMKVDQMDHNKYPVQSNNMTLQEHIVIMAQWTTMIVFDYITGNPDRLRLHFLKENRTTDFEDSVINNLAVFKTTPKLWLIDNEFGFLYNHVDGEYQEMFREYHEKMLKTCCIFQRKVVEQLVSLDKEPSPMETFLQFVFQNEPMLQKVKKYHWKIVISKETFAKRVRELVQWFEQCEKGFENYIIL